jgi:hypothetical protein
MAVMDFFEGVALYARAYSGTVYLGMFIITLIIMIIVFSFLTQKDGEKTYAWLSFGAFLLLIHSFILLSLWVGNMYIDYNPGMLGGEVGGEAHGDAHNVTPSYF